jgi:hypothetical protein
MTVLSDYVSRMVDGGLNQDEAMQIAAELFAAGVASASVRPSAGAIRTRKWRLKTSQNVTGDTQSAMSESVTKRHETSQSVTSDNTPLSSLKEDKNRKRGARLSPDWLPTEADRTFAKQLGWADGQIDSEAANFRDYWIAKPGSGGCKLDWPATWRKWVRSSKVKPAGGGGSALTPDKISLDEAVSLFAKTGRWSRHAPVNDVSQAPPELLAKYGLMADGRKLPASRGIT